ncbi:MBL fold metallo-hydrolase (plasmid) [Deinococcus metallilatus]|uniref:Glyoxylase-like metal-dependent hydrolase (Beta-lactamase superfamily II) n=1 Tax=Deinococcus metallilatus TaxID=1211322 RepID=A0AAJ5F9R9_9DEIO|nr:MBL fold metallo-hydrolase [Deinococcus metallilatus]MBB5293378.1 glyoxylase-like metal-dependent hydrolase (beta-lactamase superfamily II) [Deinococcus metallilatus]QBY06477.1 MBL fold metallo-hydrolase [Deinococcus metallilatus]RXJ17820.1 MBL fold metallo-hydrolase [Deinococcus metallilatus]TLK32092.1 MBL fold metallo-hydrolase [Deinococcus metallilatus]GMA15399.1 MBL fold hydrolase [Deinococcus metallilatus]
MTSPPGPATFPTVTRVLDTLHVLEVPIPFPMRTVTVLVDTAGPVTLIDAGLDTPEARAGLEAGLAHLGLRLPDVERVILTHHHPDHLGIAGELEEGGAPVYLLDTEIEHGGRYWQDWENWRPRLLDQMQEHGLPRELREPQDTFHRRIRRMLRPARQWTPLHEGQSVPLAGRAWEVLWLPGHADGHLGLWNAEESLLIAGDAILPRITPNIGLYAYSRPDPLGDYFGTLDRLEVLAPRRAVVGHHGPLLEGVAERARSLRDHHHERLEFLLGVARETPGSAYTLSRRMFTRELNEANLRFALAETLAHLEYLRLRGQLQRRREDGVWLYHA